MPVLTIVTKVSGFVKNPRVRLEGTLISLFGDGNGNFQSTELIEVKDGILNMVFQADGITGTDWNLDITQTQPKSKNLFKLSGTIGTTGHSLVVDAVKI